MMFSSLLSTLTVKVKRSRGGFVQESLKIYFRIGK